MVIQNKYFPENTANLMVICHKLLTHNRQKRLNIYVLYARYIPLNGNSRFLEK